MQTDMGFYMLSYLKLVYMLDKDYCLHITDKIIESQIGKATRPRPQSKSVADESPVLHSLCAFTCTTQQFLKPSVGSWRPVRSCQTARSSQPGVGTKDSLMFQIEIPIVNYDTCQEAYAPLKKKVTKDMICAGEKEGKKLTKI